MTALLLTRMHTYRLSCRSLCKVQSAAAGRESAPGRRCDGSAGFVREFPERRSRRFTHSTRCRFSTRAPPPPSRSSRRSAAFASSTLPRRHWRQQKRGLVRTRDAWRC